MEVAPPKLCFLCCFSSPAHHTDDDGNLRNNLWEDDSNLGRFFSELDQFNCSHRGANQGQRFDKEKLLKLIENCSDTVTVCEQCSKLISEAVEVRMMANRVEEKVIRMQRQLLEELRRLKDLMSKFYGRMRAIEETVIGSDLQSLENLMGGAAGGRRKRKRGDNHLILFREKISEVVVDLGAYTNDIQDKTGASLSTQHRIGQNGVPVKVEIQEVEEGTDDLFYPLALASSDSEPDLLASDNPGGVAGDVGEDLHDAQPKIKPTRLKTPRRRRKKVISKADVEESSHDEDDPMDSDYNPGGPAGPSNQDKPSSSPPVTNEPRPSKPPPRIDNKCMPSLKDAVVRAVIRRQRIHFRQFGSPPDDASSISLETPVEIRCPLSYNTTTDKITVGDFEVTITPDGLQCTICNFLTPATASDSMETVLNKIYDHVAGRLHLDCFQCHLCPKRFLQRKKYKAHLNIHKNPVSAICDICGKPLADRYNVQDHKWTHMNQEERDEALKNGTAPSLIKRQIKSQSIKKTFMCGTCGKEFSTIAYLRRHELRHQDATMICPKCGKVVKRDSYRIYHRKYVCPMGEGRGRRQCPSCDKTYQSDMSLKKHIARTHSKEAMERPYICDLCGKGYKTEEDMRYHRKTHSEVRPWKCDKCGKDFNMKRNLARHQCRAGGDIGK